MWLLIVIVRVLIMLPIHLIANMCFLEAFLYFIVGEVVECSSYVKEDSKDVSLLVSAFLDLVYHFGDHCVCRESCSEAHLIFV